MEVATKKVSVRVSQVAKAVITDDLELRAELSDLLKVQDRMIIAYMRDNEWNNRLTLKASIILISNKTGLTEEQILEYGYDDSMEMEMMESDVQKDVM